MPRITDSNQGDETYPTWETKATTTNTPKNSLSSDSNSTTLQPTDMPSESIAFAEDYTTTNRSRKRDSTAANSASKSRSRSRASSAYDMPAGENVWAQDKERQHKNFLKKALGHKLVPEFLK